MSRVLELYGISTSRDAGSWKEIVERQDCPYLNGRCIKTRKSSPKITIGTCSVLYSKDEKQIMICPHRLLERRQVFLDCIHLLTLHEPGNELHIVSEVTIPGGSVDYFLVSTKRRNVVDFAGIELQTIDTTGTVWPARQEFLQKKSLALDDSEIDFTKRFGMNWKMTAKTILVQLNHKIRTLENINKHLVLVIQDHLLEYMRREFKFDHLNLARLGDPMHIHTYTLNQIEDGFYRLDLNERFSTDAEGIAVSLGLQADPNIALEKITANLEARISQDTLFTF